MLCEQRGQHPQASAPKIQLSRTRSVRGSPVTSDFAVTTTIAASVNSASMSIRRCLIAW